MDYYEISYLDQMSSNLIALLYNVLKCVIPVLTYAAKTWSITGNNYKQLETTQRAMISSILGTRRIDKIKIETMYEKTKMQNIMIHIKQMKW